MAAENKVPHTFDDLTRNQIFQIDRARNKVIEQESRRRFGQNIFSPLVDGGWMFMTTTPKGRITKYALTDKARAALPLIDKFNAEAKARMDADAKERHREEMVRAAAPELLAAIIRLRDLPVDCSQQEDVAAWEQAQAAISKAT